MSWELKGYDRWLTKGLDDYWGDEPEQDNEDDYGDYLYEQWKDRKLGL